MSGNVQKLHVLDPREELAYLYEIHGAGNHAKLFSVLIQSFDVLQYRAQLLLSLVTICLTITGFSGPKIAASSFFSKICIAYGLTFVLMSALVLLTGPLQLRWGTQRRGECIADSLVAMIHLRNVRSRWYHVASVLLIIGLTGYVGSVVGYLFQI